MKTFLAAVTAAVLLSAATGFAAGKDTRVFELRTYTTAPGKLADLNARFRNHTCKLFERHGMENIGYWVPLDADKGADNTLIYIIAHQSRDAAKKSWAAFQADPDWQAARKKSEEGGKILAKAPESVFMSATDYSAAIKAFSGGDRVFEMRTYTTEPGRLPNLHARFRDHTCKLFEKHGMTNIGYWSPQDAGQGADNTLIYVLAHQSRDAAKESFGAFGKDPGWQAARKASEEKAGGSLTVKGGVKSVFMKATDYSPIK
ncbi:MAG: NIPSNAP family protein [Verrucomicrobia bacterium]|nr:NIPSNAP family protein [Verrucomicrobiota bacterium]